MAGLYSHGVIGLRARLDTACGLCCHPCLDEQQLSAYIHNLGGAAAKPRGTRCKAQMGCIRLSWLFKTLVVTCRMLVALGSTTDPTACALSAVGDWQHDLHDLHVFNRTARHQDIFAGSALGFGSGSDTGKCMQHVFCHVELVRSLATCSTHRYDACHLAVDFDCCFASALGRSWPMHQTFNWCFCMLYRPWPIRRTFSWYFGMRYRRDCTVHGLFAETTWVSHQTLRAFLYSYFAACLGKWRY